MDWKYLESDAFKVRYALATYFIPQRAGWGVIEVGGGKTPISDFIAWSDYAGIVVIDPLVPELFLESSKHWVQHIQQRLEDVAPFEIPNKFALVLMGLDIKTGRKELRHLVEHADKVIVEFASVHPPAVELADQIRVWTDRRQTFHIGFDLRKNDVGDMTGSYPPRFRREFFVLG